MVSTFGTGKIADEKIAQLVLEHFDLRPKGIVKMLNLLRPIYRKTAAYGHFGREEPEFTWEQCDKAPALRAAAGLQAITSSIKVIYGEIDYNFAIPSRSVARNAVIQQIPRLEGSMILTEFANCNCAR